MLPVAMATSLLHRVTIITVYKIIPKSKLVDLIGLNNLKKKWVGLHLKAILWKSPVMLIYVSLCVTDFYVHKKNSLIFMEKSKRLLTSVAKIRGTYIFFWFSERQFNGACLWQFCCLQHLYQILEVVGEGGRGGRIPNSII